MNLISATLPRIIQGGMGIAVSDWHLAREVSLCGQMGVVSGVGIDIVISRRLQLGDIGGHIRRALSHFPVPEIADKIITKYFKPEGKLKDEPFELAPRLTIQGSQFAHELAVCANFVEVWLAKEGHNGLVGINYLEKIQLAHLSALYGAMLAGVDFVLMGAGIPLRIPQVLDGLAVHEPVSYRINVDNELSGMEHWHNFDPKSIIKSPTEPIKRPNFLPIISSATLAEMFVNKAKGKVNGFIIEGPTAGGHNAPPRGKPIFNEFDEPVYGERDVVDLERVREFGLPFWLAGGYASPSKIEDAISKGAAGVQLGSIFALSSGSGMRPDLKRSLIRQAYAGEMVARTDALASPSGFPFKVAQLTQTLSNPENYKKRCRICDITRLRHPAQKPDGSIVYRCPSEPVASYLGKGGKEEETHGRKCLCNALLSDVGLEQHQMNGYDEQPLVTIGDNVDFIRDLVSSPEGSYTAADAIKYLTRVAVPVA